MDFGLFKLPVNIDFLMPSWDGLGVGLTFDLMKLTSSRNDATPFFLWINRNSQLISNSQLKMHAFVSNVFTLYSLLTNLKIDKEVRLVYVWFFFGKVTRGN